MIVLHLVGIGSLGSTLASEIAKRATALKINLAVRLYDFDIVEDRNVVSQDFTPAQVGLSKVEAVQFNLAPYDRISTTGICQRIEEGNYGALMEFEEGNKHIIIDAVDNIETRQLLWLIGMTHAVPCIHLAMSTAGTGRVEWTHGEYDSFHLSPKNMSHAQITALKANYEDKKLAPCMLNSFRSLIFNTSIAGCTSLFGFMGFDGGNEFEAIHDGQPFAGLMSNWEVSLKSLDWNKSNIGLGEF